MKETDYKILKPDQTLQKYVDYFWAGKVCLKNSAQKYFQYLAPASTSIDLVFFCEGLFNDNETGSDLFQNGIVYGQKSSFDNYSTTSEIATLFGIKLKPSVLLTTLNIPAYEISGQQISVQSLFGYEGEKITEVILTSRTLEKKFIAFSAFLREKLKDISPKYQTLEKLIQTIDYTTDYSALNSLTENYFLSKRQFERDFKTLTGFSFKRFIKLKRFENCFQALQANRIDLSLTQIAYQFGFYDQAHLNRDFKEFTGLSPKEFARVFCIR